MGCNCGKPKCNGKCGCKSPVVLQINNPAEYITFHKVSIPAAMGDSKTNPPAVGKYKNVLLYYEADQTSWLYSTDGIPTKLTNGLTNYEDITNLPQINGVTIIGNKTSEDFGITDTEQINSAVNSEAQARQSADNGLQSQIDAKQDKLTEAQLNAVNSGITADKVTTYDGYAEQIAGKAEKGEVGQPGPAGPQGPQGEPGPQGPAGTNGVDGFSPIATVTQTSTGATISITDSQGTTTANITNGSDANVPIATASVAGKVKPDGTTITVSSDGTITSTATYTLPQATDTTLGGIKVGDNLSIDGDGVLSATASPILYSTTGQNTDGSMTQKTATDMVFIAGKDQSTSPSDVRICIGGTRDSYGSNGVRIGRQAMAQGTESVSIGSGTQANYDYSCAIGSNAYATSQSACAIAVNSEASGNSAIALGNGAKAENIGSVALGMGSIADNDYEVSVGSGNSSHSGTYQYRKIVNVADAVNVHDAVTKGQLDTAIAGIPATNNIDSTDWSALWQ